MITLARSDQSHLGRWWWTVDRWTLATLAILIGIGIMLIQAATPAVAIKHGWSHMYFVQRHVVMLVPAVIAILGISMLSPRLIRLCCALGLALMLPLLLLTPFIGVEIKGAIRWVQFAGLSIQPSEFIKPLFVVTSAWLFARQCERKGFPALSVNLALYGVIALGLVMQPDMGMTTLITIIWLGQFFLAGLPIMLVGMALVGMVLAGITAYYALPHFASRLDRFLHHTGDTFQVDRALDAFTKGGLMGTGPGEGTVKMSIPDAHADFVFAVAGEELGLICCLFIIGLYAFIVLRGLWRLKQENNLFILLAAGGLLMQFGLQALINFASTLHLIPAKGMTLPFISYGGSSLLALALGMGILLGLTRKRFGMHDL